VPGDPRIRASDADRDRAAALLREHHAAGRLTAEEFGQRLDAALDATTLGEIDELLADLPVIDLYRLPDEGLRRAPGLPHQALSRSDAGGLPAVPPATLAMGAWGAVAGVVVAVWAVAAVVGVGTWFPWWLLVVIPWVWVMIRRARRRGE
jgi:hypothetical protein